ncbi:MAG: 50S ribosomal protein L21 [Thermoguttaceae bacterium]|nr:50S ribosomal protein L21 [Thermoguttaceae bacterium]
MYAIFKDGGHQYKAEVGRKMLVELHDVNEGDTLEFDEVLLIGEAAGDEKTIVGQPTIAGAKVVTKVLGDFKGPKVVIRWFRRRKNSRRKNGHRQKYTLVEVVEIAR